MATTTRTYVALTLDQARFLPETRLLRAPLRGFAPSPDLSGSDLEEAEFQAAQLAAKDAIVRQVPVLVAALEIPASIAKSVHDSDEAQEARELTGVGAVLIEEDVALSRVAALHLADDTLEGETLDATAPDPLELSWYDTTEIHHVAQLITDANN